MRLSWCVQKILKDLMQENILQQSAQVIWK